MKPLFVAFLLLSAVAQPVLEMEAPTSLEAERAGITTFFVWVENSGNLTAKNVTLSIETPWQSSKNSLFPRTPRNVRPGEGVNYTVKIRPPFEGSYSLSLAADCLQGSEAVRGVDVEVPLETSWEVNRSEANSTEANLTAEPELEEQLSISQGVMEVRLQIGALEPSASPAALELLERAGEAASSAETLQEEGRREEAMRKLSRAESLLKQAAAMGDGPSSRPVYAVLIAFVAAVASLFWAEATGKNPIQSLRSLIGELRGRAGL